MGIDRKYLLAMATGLPSLCGWLNRKRPLIVTYHGIYDGPKRDNAMPATFVHVDDFTAQIAFLIKRFRPLDPAEFLDVVRSGAPFPKNTLFVTFDDGYESFDRLARPVLESHGVRAVVFMATEYLFTRKPFWYDLVWLFFIWADPEAKQQLFELIGAFVRPPETIDLTCDSVLATMKRLPPKVRRPLVDKLTAHLKKEAPTEIRTLLQHFHAMTPEQLINAAKAGTWIGGHTHSHTILSALPSADAEAEILQNRKILGDLVEEAGAYFAYPNGGQQDFGDEHKAMLKRAGYEVAFSLTQHRSDVHQNLFDVSRFHVAQEDTVCSLSFRCTGVGSWFSRARPFSKIWQDR